MRISTGSGLGLIILSPFLAVAVAQEDRVGFPQGYDKSFTLYHVFNRADRPQLRQLWINPVGARSEAGKPFPYGTVIVMETYQAKTQEGKPEKDEKGLYVKGDLNRIDITRKEKGYGEGYGASRSGEWEYNAYRADGKLTPGDTARCAKCHIDTSDTDFVYTAKEIWKKK